MSRVKSLGYVGCDISDSKAWDQLLGQVFGLEARADTPDRVLQYRLDDNHHRLALHESGQDRLKYLGWEVETEEDLKLLAQSLKDKGVNIAWGDDELCQERAVMDLVFFDGPDQVRNEVFFAPTQDFKPFTPRRGMAGFNTGELGMGHVVLAASDRDQAVAWYQEMLGFRLSDYIFWDDVKATFLHCNPRHHSLALMNTVGGMQGGDLGHFMLESRSLDDVGRAYDAVNELNIPIAFTYGKHTNDQTTSFYVFSPSGWLVEYGYGGRLIDDSDWEPRLYNSPKIWGHEMQSPPGGADKENAKKY